MLTYGFSLQGKSHVRNNTVCQDANCIQKLENGAYLLIAADGVGSAKYSDAGSKMAVEKLAEYCFDNIEKKAKENEQIDILKSGFSYAMNAILEYSKKNGEMVEKYDTTLSAAIYDGKRVVFGHAGDGGILVKTCCGIYHMITERQKGVDGMSVRPLRAGDCSWSFGSYSEDVAAVMVMTDGILDGVMTPYLLNFPLNEDFTKQGNKNLVYITAAEFFMNGNCVWQRRRIKEPEKIYRYFLMGDFQESDKKQFADCLLHGYEVLLGKLNAGVIMQTVYPKCIPLYFLQEVMDDKTIVCAINEKCKVKYQPVSYYCEPDWHKLNESYNRFFYPERYNQKVVEKKQEKQYETSLKEKSKNVKHRVGLLVKKVERVRKRRRAVHVTIDVLLCMAIIIVTMFCYQIWQINVDAESSRINELQGIVFQLENKNRELQRERNKLQKELYVRGESVSGSAVKDKNKNQSGAKEEKTGE